MDPGAGEKGYSRDALNFGALANPCGHGASWLSNRNYLVFGMPQAKPSYQYRPPIKGKKTGSGAWIAYAIGIGLFCGVIGALAVIWWREGFPRMKETGVAYEQFKSIRVDNGQYAMLATLAVQTRASDADWAKRNGVQLQHVLTLVLNETDVESLHNPGGLMALQDRLTQTANEAFSGSHVQQVFVTDLIYQAQE
jgi:flagellar basal body-associated protein FliL